MGLLFWCNSALALPIDLNDFFFFAGDPVTVSANGTSATIGESAGFSPIVLSNDPFLGDPEVIIAGVGILLLFDYSFIEGAASNDEFGAFIIDPVTGGSIGSGFEFFTNSTSSGTVSFDLSTLAGITGLGLQFQLSSLASDFDFLSTVTISNLRLVSASVPVSSPPTWLLLIFGILGMFRLRRSNNELQIKY
ncbi:MAG: hypothetical protein ACU843_18805 [Gammaproteobacteria bacterium]